MSVNYQGHLDCSSCGDCTGFMTVWGTSRSVSGRHKSLMNSLCTTSLKNGIRSDYCIGLCREHVGLYRDSMELSWQ